MLTAERTSTMLGDLNLSENVSLPASIVTTTIGILAVKGAGKTYTFSVMAEEMLKAGLQVIIVDPVGVCWGLRSSADGESEGLPILVLGGDHGDLQLEHAAGEFIADFSMESGQSIVLDLSDFSNNQMVQFVTAFAERLYHKNKRPIHLILDEADAFCPQSPMPGERQMLGAIDKVVRRGRAKGIGVTLVSQRPAVIHKNVLTQIEILVALRIASPQDRAAIEAWINVHGTPEQRKELMDSLADLPTGTAWFWSPTLGIFNKARVRKRETFDSSKTPEIGAVLIEPKRLATVDLELLREKMTAYEQEVPVLKGKVSKIDIEEQISQAVQRATAAVAKRCQQLDEAFSQIATIIESTKVIDSLKTAVTEVGKLQEYAEEKGLLKNNQAPSGLTINTPRLKIINTLSSFKAIGVNELSKGNLAVFSDQSPKSSGFRANLGWLSTNGLITYVNGNVALTKEGSKFAQKQDSACSLEQLHQAWFAKLPKPQGRMLKVLIGYYPASIDRAALADGTGQSPKSSGFRANLGKLSSLGLLQYVGQEVKATRLLFPEGLTERGLGNE